MKPMECTNIEWHPNQITGKAILVTNRTDLKKGEELILKKRGSYKAVQGEITEIIASSKTRVKRFSWGFYTTKMTYIFHFKVVEQRPARTKSFSLL